MDISRLVWYAASAQIISHVDVAESTWVGISRTPLLALLMSSPHGKDILKAALGFVHLANVLDTLVS